MLSRPVIFEDLARQVQAQGYRQRPGNQKPFAIFLQK